MKLRNLVASALVAGAMIAPATSMAATITPGSDLFINVGVGNDVGFGGTFDAAGYAAVSFMLSGIAGTTIGSAVSISAPGPLNAVQANIYQDTNLNGLWDTGLDLLIATGTPVTPLSSTVTALHLVSGVKYFVGITGPSKGGYGGSISAVPLPAAAWLFGSALLGFMGWSNRRKV